MLNLMTPSCTSCLRWNIASKSTDSRDATTAVTSPPASPPPGLCPASPAASPPPRCTGDGSGPTIDTELLSAIEGGRWPTGVTAAPAPSALTSRSHATIESAIATSVSSASCLSCASCSVRSVN